MNKLARTVYEAALKQPEVMTKTKDQLAEEAALHADSSLSDIIKPIVLAALNEFEAQQQTGEGLMLSQQHEGLRSHDQTGIARLYVVGFLFDEGDSNVALIRKKRPEWQLGSLNGLGGHIEVGESPHAAMRREFREESGLDVEFWREFCVLEGDGGMSGEPWKVHFFEARGHVHRLTSMTDEQIQIVAIAELHNEQLIKNLLWLIPLALDGQPPLVTQRAALISSSNQSATATKGKEEPSSLSQPSVEQKDSGSETLSTLSNPSREETDGATCGMWTAFYHFFSGEEGFSPDSRDKHVRQLFDYFLGGMRFGQSALGSGVLANAQTEAMKAKPVPKVKQTPTYE